ncbi:MAG TPA: lysophospholipid acyltransferase family protein [Mariprofundaceae bacterium]|nr:lysophospholipid acyltransferase family protein [Mariprofundaceae bacterium]
MTHNLPELAVRLLFWIIRLMPVRLVGAVGAGIGRAFSLVDRRHRDITLRNLTRIYPDRPRRWRRRMARESFAELGRTIFELPHVYLRSHAFLRSRVTVEGESELRAALAEGHGAILVACHHSNWEFGALMFSILGLPTNIIYRQLNNPALDRFLKACRERFGAQMRDRNQSLRWLPKALKEGAVAAIMIDQHLSTGTPVPFLGHLAATTLFPAVYAYKYHTPVFGVALHRIGRSFRFRLQFWPITLPEPTGAKDADAFYAMKAMADSFSSTIHARPELWLWSHRRWLILEQERMLADVVYGTP